MIGKVIDTYYATNTIDNFFLFLAGLAIITTPCLRFGANLILQKYNAKTRAPHKKLLIINIIKPSNRKISQGRAIDLIDGDTDGTIYLYHGIYLDITLNLALLIFAFAIILCNYPIYALPPAIAIVFSLIVHCLYQRKLPNLFNQYIEQNTIFLETVCTDLRSNKKLILKHYTSACRKILKPCVTANLKVCTLEFLSSLSYLLGLATLILIYTFTTSHETSSIGAFIAVALYIEKALAPVFSLVGIYYSTAESLSRQRRADSILRTTP
ncbi:hypothetical protein [Pseudomonas sp. R5(2019)]|uniref:hypothetical protein n=1 Tax=Pseudomonas sp. R5(2019) TaxID=2697566 RepID=UPI0014135131|nr:hypothetical protein [Pseudomonas sp. R5(2019)]NBA94394.1 hypothetical protein [Pseudomonas sp. R5(2019)]